MSKPGLNPKPNSKSKFKNASVKLDKQLVAWKILICLLNCNFFLTISNSFYDKVLTTCIKYRKQNPRTYSFYKYTEYVSSTL